MDAGRAYGKQKKMLKKMIRAQAMPLTTKPALPIQKGPLGVFCRLLRRCGRMARRYDIVVKMIKLPTRLLNPALEPNWMAPKAVHRTAQRTVACIGHESLSLT